MNLIDDTILEMLAEIDRKIDKIDMRLAEIETDIDDLFLVEEKVDLEVVVTENEVTLIEATVEEKISESMRRKEIAAEIESHISQSIPSH